MVSLRLKLSVAGKSKQRGHGYQKIISATTGSASEPTCESPQLDAARHVVVEEDAAAFVVALEDGVQGLGADAVAWRDNKRQILHSCK